MRSQWNGKKQKKSISISASTNLFVLDRLRARKWLLHLILCHCEVIEWKRASWTIQWRRFGWLKKQFHSLIGREHRLICKLIQYGHRMQYNGTIHNIEINKAAWLQIRDNFTHFIFHRRFYAFVSINWRFLSAFLFVCFLLNRLSRLINSEWRVGQRDFWVCIRPQDSSQSVIFKANHLLSEVQFAKKKQYVFNHN